MTCVNAAAMPLYESIVGACLVFVFKFFSSFRFCGVSTQLGAAPPMRIARRTLTELDRWRYLQVAIEDDCVQTL